MFGGFDAPTQRVALRRGDFFAEIWPELGGAVARFERWQSFGASGARPLFRSTPDQRHYLPTDLANFPLLPYSNRIAHGRFQSGASVYQLPRNTVDSEHPLHGVGWIRPWRLHSQHTDRCVMRLVHPGDDDWPWAFTAVQNIALTDTGLELRLDLINRDRTAMPFGLGQHPYLQRPVGTRIFAPVEGVWLSDEQGLPLQRVRLPAQWDLPYGKAFDACSIDHCFDGLSGDVWVEWPDGCGLRLSSSPVMPFLVIYSVPERDFICVEPVSHRPDAFNACAADGHSAGVAMLEPGHSTSAVHCFDYVPAPGSGGR